MNDDCRPASRPPQSSIINHQSRRGFTLLELLVALAILSAAFAIIWSSFSAVVSAWKKGTEVLDDLHHGDFVMEQLVASLRSAAYFPTAPDKYGFRLRDRGGEYPSDMMSWVCSGTSFVPEGSPLRQGLHRLVVTIEPNEDGDDAVAVRAYPHLADMEDDDPDPWFISTEVKGLECRVYNFEDEAWEDRWENTNEIPSVLEITLFMDPIEDYGDPITLKRLVEIPVAPVVTQGVKWAESGTGARGEDTSGKNEARGAGAGVVNPNPDGTARISAER